MICIFVLQFCALSATVLRVRPTAASVCVTRSLKCCYCCCHITGCLDIARKIHTYLRARTRACVHYCLKILLAVRTAAVYILTVHIALVSLVGDRHVAYFAILLSYQWQSERSCYRPLTGVATTLTITGHTIL